MSDDEYCYDEYDELNELLYDADAEPDLADDLAAHATYSPIWQDDPSEELRDYFSDWEYYSDDYFDDDPKLLDRDAKSLKSESKSMQPPKRGKKRKLSEARDMTEQKRKEIMALTACLRGTVWKGMSPEPAESFKLGTEKPVALQLSKDIMRAAYNKERGFGKGRLKRDESWANNLSLVDMGLTTETGMGVREGNAEASQVDGDEDPEDQSMVEDEEEMIDEEIAEAQSVNLGVRSVEIQLESAPQSIVSTQAESEDDTRPRKRRKAGDLQKPTNQDALPTPDASLDSEGEPDLDKANGTVSQKRKGRSAKTSAKSKTSAVQEQKDEKPQTQGRKRKLSVAESNATGSTASSRAKRIATEQTVELTAAATRPSRTRKK